MDVGVAIVSFECVAGKGELREFISLSRLLSQPTRFQRECPCFGNQVFLDSDVFASFFPVSRCFDAAKRRLRTRRVS